MPTITQIQVGTTTYDIIDSSASTEITEIKENTLRAQYNENTETIEFVQGITSITSNNEYVSETTLWGNIEGSITTQTDLMNLINEKQPFWTKQGEITGNTETITVPNTATVVMVIITTTVNNVVNFYTGIGVIESLSDRWNLGGYWYSSSDHGLINLDVTNNGRTFGTDDAV